ncbi:MAG TPA: FAD-dependent monooxygenase [Kofleriaceae bacterium]|nr:FAD-dependent monooxygenase [Kofleriaceae bacterium]
MKIVSIGGGPAGLYLGILMKRADPSHEVRVLERNRADDTFGFGVVFSDATLGNLGEADPESYAEIRRHFAHWDDIDTFYQGQRIRSTGHGFCGLERRTLLGILQRRCQELGVRLDYEREARDFDALAREADVLVGADGVASGVREHWAAQFQPEVTHRPNKFVWLGTTVPFEAFTFYFNENEHGLWRVHAYRYQETGSTFIVECTDDTWHRSGMARADEDQTIAYLEELFAAELGGHRLIKNRSIWRSFPTIRNRRWHHDNVVLVGDAVHTAHFSIGSGTKLAMEDCIALARTLGEHPEVPAALAAYERERRPDVEKWQRAAQVSLEWFEDTERYLALEPLQFAASLLTRSLRVTHANLAKRDPSLAGRIAEWFAARAARACGRAVPDGPVAPSQNPLRLRGMLLENRLVAAPSPLADARGGIPGEGVRDHLLARARGGAGLVMTEPLSATALGQDDPRAGLWADEHTAAWAAITAAVHACDGSIGALLGLDEPPVPIAGRPGLELEAALVGATQRAAEAGFDLLELDLSSGLLLELAAEPRERDELVAVVAAVRAAWPVDRPLGVRVAATDWGEGDITPEDAVALVRALKQRGVGLATVVSVPEGRPDTRLVHVQLGDRVRLETGIPVVTEGGVWSIDDADSVVVAGRADLVAYVGDADFRPARP